MLKYFRIKYYADFYFQRRKTMKKLISIVLILSLVFCFAACGSKEGGEKGGKAEDVKGAEQTVGNITVFVPDGYKLAGGNITGTDKDNPDPDSCYIQPETPNMFDYYTIQVSTEEQATSNIEMSKSANADASGIKDVKDVETKIGDVTWKGFSYLYESDLNSDIPCGAYYATIGETVYYVMVTGHAIDSAEAAAVLGSLK